MWERRDTRALEVEVAEPEARGEDMSVLARARVATEMRSSSTIAAATCHTRGEVMMVCMQLAE